MPGTSASQLDLFRPTKSSQLPPPMVWPPEIAALARNLHPRIHFGTSSWTFPGWANLCYPAGITEEQLLTDGLRLYTRYPLFRTVGIDRSYYKPLTRKELEDYADQLPPGFKCTEKVWDRLMFPVFPAHPRYGADAGRVNPSFLDAEVFHDHVHAPHVGVFEDHLAAYILEFPPIPAETRPRPEAFARRLARFLDQAPYGPRYAVELRNPDLLSEAYFEVLRERNVAHVYNYWSNMPSIGAQLDAAEPSGEILVARLMTRPGEAYEARKARFAPFDRIQDADPDMRDDVVRLARKAIKLDRDLFIIVNNKAEGSSPLTIAELAAMMVSG